MRFLLISLVITISLPSFSQSRLTAGFDAQEHIGLFAVARYNVHFADSLLGSNRKDRFTLLYQSPEVGLKNQWSFFKRADNVGLIAIRGTIGDKTSWLANFYAAMIPATGSLQLTDSNRFNFKLAADPRATVHVGWAVSLGFMAEDILNQVKEQYSRGVKDFFIFGHSQGGAIAFLATSYLRHLQLDGKLPKDITFKTYCNAGPKPGNMYYAYDYDFITRGGWGFNVVNASDWVPETPFTVQRIQDMNSINPLVHTKDMLKDQKLPVRLVGGYLYGKINRKPRKVQRMYNRIFGNTLYNVAIKKALQQYQKPSYSQTANFMRAGVPIVLIPDAGYNAKFRFDETRKNYFVHHNFGAYFHLLKKYYY